MADISKITSIVQDKTLDKLQPQVPGKTNVNFGNMVHDYLKKVDSDQKLASTKVQEVISNKSENIHEAMVALEEASISFQLLMEVRNKLLESVQELKRTQV